MKLLSSGHLLGLLLAAWTAISPSWGGAPDLRVIAARNALPMEGAAGLLGPDYYIDGGENVGLLPGMLLRVERAVSVRDHRTGKNFETRIAFATVRVIRVHPELAIARIESIDDVDVAPIVSPRAVMIGDAVRPQPEAEPVAPQPTEPARLSLPSSILFSLDGAELSEEGARSLLLLQATPLGRMGGSIRVEGHTCDLGNELHNLDLSRRRAQAVIDHLATVQGFPRERLALASLGETTPLAPNTSEQNRRRNRRVDLVFIPDDR